MDRSRNWLIRILAWRAKQPAEVSWFAASGLFLAALVARILAGHMYGANPVLVFYPAILIAATVLGWKEATAVLVLSVAVGAYLFLPSELYLMPIAWLIVGGLNITLLAALQHVARELLAAHERNPATDLAPAGDTPIEAAGPARSGGKWMFADRIGLVEDSPEDAFSTIVDLSAADLTISVEPSQTTRDRTQAITSLVVAAGDRVQERVFRNPEGAKLRISLRAIDSGRPVLTVVNYGPDPLPVVSAPEAVPEIAAWKA